MGSLINFNEQLDSIFFGFYTILMSLITEVKLENIRVVSNLMRSEKMRSKIVALLLVLGNRASVTACGGSETETGEDFTPLTEETVDTEAAETELGQDIPEEIQ